MALGAGRRSLFSDGLHDEKPEQVMRMGSHSNPAWKEN
jgi:hypothetical protein